MHVQGAHQPRLLHHQELIDLELLHHLHRFHREPIRADGAGIAVHYFGNGKPREVQGSGGGLLQSAPQIAVGIDADHPLVLAQDRGHPQSFAGNFQNRIAQHGAVGNRGYRFAGSHHVPHAGQKPAPQDSSGVGARKVLGAEAPCLQQRQRQRVSQRQGRGRARRRRQVEGTGLLVHAGVQVRVGFPAQGGAGVAGHGDELRAQALEQGNDGEQLLRLTRVGEGEQHVISGHHAKVAMAGLDRVYEEGRSASAGEGGGDLAGNVAGLADPAHHHPSLAVIDQVNGREK